MNLNPKFSIGDKVFFVSTTTTTGRHDCPDCGGSKVWEAKSPAGQTIEMDCPRCTRRHYDAGLSLDYTKSVPWVRELTIGSVRIDTAAEKPISYMCQETGVGSGSVYYEESLFSDRDYADAEAARMCAIKQGEFDSMPSAMDAREAAKHAYFDALRFRAAKEVEAEVRSRLRNDLQENLPEGEHTPGPWVCSVSQSDDGVVSFDVRSEDIEHEYRSFTVCSGYGGLCDGYATKRQGLPNARLIAAAPDLLAALILARDKARGFMGDCADTQSLPEIDAAIAKATGESA